MEVTSSANDRAVVEEENEKEQVRAFLFYLIDERLEDEGKEKTG